jgi:hypothetical protein
MSPLFGKAAETDATGRFDRVIFKGPDGTLTQITGAQFDGLALAERIKVILDGKPKFSLNGKDVSLMDAVRRI